jgi:hypothetical protein
MQPIGAVSLALAEWRSAGSVLSGGAQFLMLFVIRVKSLRFEWVWEVFLCEPTVNAAKQQS